MPKKDLNDKQKIVYEMLEVLSMEVGDLWETRGAIEEWVNDCFQAIDEGIDEYHLEWQ